MNKMSKKTKTILTCLLFALFIASAAFLYRYLTDHTEAPNNLIAETKEGEAAPSDTSNNTDSNEPNSDEKEKTKAFDFTAIDSEGNEVKLSDFFGKPIVLNFWASWCTPCKSEMKDFNEVYLELGEDTQFMMVNMTDGQRETLSDGQDYIAEQEFSFPVFYDIAQEAAYSYEVTSIPTTIFIDKEGYLTAIARGAIPKDTLMEGIRLIE